MRAPEIALYRKDGFVSLTLNSWIEFLGLSPAAWNYLNDLHVRKVGDITAVILNARPREKVLKNILSEIATKLKDFNIVPQSLEQWSNSLEPIEKAPLSSVTIGQLKALGIHFVSGLLEKTAVDLQDPRTTPEILSEVEKFFRSRAHVFHKNILDRALHSNEILGLNDAIERLGFNEEDELTFAYAGIHTVGALIDAANGTHFEAHFVRKLPNTRLRHLETLLQSVLDARGVFRDRTDACESELL